MAKQELKLLEEVSKQWVSYRTKNKIQQNSCILACNFVHQILIRLGVDHQVIPVGTTVFNRRGWELFGIPANKLPSDAWQVHCSSASTGKGFGGHVVIQTDTNFFDPTSMQFARPEHNIFVGETLIVPLSEMQVHTRDDKPHPIHLLYRATEFRTFPIGSGLYSYYLEKWNTVYRKSPDWTISPKDLGIAEIVAEMRK